MVEVDVPALGIEPKPRRMTIDQFVIMQVAFGVLTTAPPLPASTVYMQIQLNSATQYVMLRVLSARGHLY
jgi:hypothetical protein